MGIKNNSFAISQVIAAVVIWAASFIAMKIAVAELGAFPTVFLRMLLAVAVLMFFLPKVKRETQNYQKGDGWLLLGLVLAEPCLYFVFEGLALTYTSASEAGMITALHPFMVTVCAFYFLKESINRRMVVGGLMAVAGAILLSLTGESGESGSNHMLGNGLEFIAICFATAYSLLARKLASRYSPVFLTTLQAVFGCLFFLPLAFMFNPGMPESISTEVIFSILFLAWGVNVIAFILYNASLKSMPASQVGMWMNLLPLATLFFGWLLLGETLTDWQYVAVVLVISGVIYSQLKPKPKTVFIEQSVIEPSMVDDWLVAQKSEQAIAQTEDSKLKAG
ncbi:DMT family transporter [Aliikangiella marina]|uniref:DMT family transporter n=1 Tax=Aliikangiella marina TaxID=1712262 RepID=A0A545T8X0_9GAMM|nr:DMT family transporter [Aliikangiella marina]TQV73666.1 DMT family transporter [Aliikangiella marina]